MNVRVLSRCPARLVSSLALSLAACTGGTSDVDVPPAVPEFGDARSFAVLAEDGDGLDIPRDLGFHPDRTGELWVLNRETDAAVILFDAGEPTQRIEERKDIYANHFMEEASSIAFGANDTFGSCGESRNTYDDQAPANNFMGPALWSSDLEIFAEENQSPFSDMLGSHIDMLHQSPLCMGIAHDEDNAYWVFDGYNGHVVYYDFRDDHGPGYDDHSDGIVRRYPEAEVTYLEDVPGHLILDKDTGWLYVADTGAGRVFRLDTGSGERGDTLVATNEPLAEFSEMEGATVEVIAEGLDEPSGIAFAAGRLFVTDHATNAIIAYDTTAAGFPELGRITAEAEAIMGIEVGPDGALYYVDGGGDKVVRIDAEDLPPATE